MKLEKTYQPAEHEPKIYQLWEKSGAFQPRSSTKAKPYCIIMPPPNANADLHAGQAMYVIEDIMTRYRRMQGDAVLWLPGTDHAGIETQFVFEKELAKKGQSRFDFGPAKFAKAALDYTLSNQHKQLSQMRSLGFSPDWSRHKFSLDPDIVEEVYKTFAMLFKDGLVYRGNRIVNWCTKCQSGFADVEVKHVERDDHLYTLNYGPLIIATTRPETIFADVAVAVNPKDRRYSKLVGQSATIPFVDRPVPIVADNQVDPSFGTGALKITPGHDPNDYEIGLRQKLPEISVIDLTGQMINVPSELAGLSVNQARTKTVELLKHSGKLVDIVPYHHAVGTHDRCGTVIEPLITEQWFLKVQSLVEPAINAVKTGKTKIIPKRFEKVYLQWLENLHDWNISRQNWFGIRIPIYYKASNDPAKKPYIFATTDQEAKAYYGAGNFRAETDIFDTWFSSSQWPFVTLMTTGQYDRFYPTDLMATARDILTKWVVTMMMMGLYRTGKVPFRDVYLWGMVNDAQGKKMSKSRGNTINPLALTDRYGTDALRLALVTGITPGNDGSLSEAKVEAYRNFCNKLWNVARFVLDKAENYSSTPPQPIELHDKWLVFRLDKAIKSISMDLDNYRFSDAAQTIYHLLWDDFADWYIESSKVALNQSMLIYGLETILKLAHPFAPFVTEAVWQNLPWQNQSLIESDWPTVTTDSSSSSAKEFVRVQTLVSRIRNLSKEVGQTKLTLLHKASPLVEANITIIKTLAKLKQISQVEQGRGLELEKSLWLDLTNQQLRDLKQKLSEQLRVKSGYAKTLTAKVENPKFQQNAPAAIYQQEADRLAQIQKDVDQLASQVEELK